MTDEAQTPPVDTSDKTGVAAAFTRIMGKKDTPPVETPPAEAPSDTPPEETPPETPPLELLEKDTPPTETPPVADTPPETSPPSEAPPVADTPPSETPPETPPVKSETEKLELLDLPETPPAPATDTFDYGSLAKEIGVEGSTREEIVKAIKDTSQPERAQTRYSEAERIENSGGDGMAYLFADKSRKDIEKMSSKELLLDRYKEEAKKDGFDIDFVIDSKGAEESSFLANEHRASLLRNLDVTQDSISRKAAANKLEVDNGIKHALGNMKGVDGFKLTDADRKTMENDLKTGAIVNEMFYGPDGKKDYAIALENAYRYRNSKKIIEFWKTKSANGATKKVIASLGNHDITNPKPESTGSPNVKVATTGAVSLVNAMKERLTKGA